MIYSYSYMLMYILPAFLVVSILFLIAVVKQKKRIVNDRLNIEQELYQREILLKGITEAANILVSVTEYDETFKNALRILGELVDADRVLFAERQYMSNGEVLEMPRFEWSRNGNEIQDDELRLDKIAQMEVTFRYNKESSDSIVTGLTSEMPNLNKEILKRLNIKSILIIPIIIDNVNIGLMIFSACRQEKIWSKVEQEALKVAAVSIGGTYKRIQTEKTLRDILKDDFKKTVQNLQNLIFKVKRDEQGSFVFILFEGKKAYELGFDTSKVYGMKPMEFLPTSIAEQFNNAFGKAFKGDTAMFESSDFGWNSYSILSPVFDGGIVTEVVGSVFDITDLKNAQDRIENLAFYDSLTGLPNRTLCIERINSAIYQSKRFKKMFAIFFMDLDRFKLINDSLGHAIGDELLKLASERLKENLREIDTTSRIGGDEFILIIKDINNINDIEKIAQKVLDKFRQPFLLKEHELYLSTSIGISLYPEDGKNTEELIKYADMAMYKAKELGRDNYQFFNNLMNNQANERLRKEYDLRKAVDQGDFFLVYQPIVDILTGKVTTVEALLRWKHSTQGVINPGDFIPLAEDTGLILPIGEWVLFQACMQIKEWHDLGFNDLIVSVNMSAKHFQQQGIVEIIKGALKAANIEPHFLELEITENSIITNIEKTISIINSLKELGILVAIDDFGKGFSSMAYLKRFDADILKIDQFFINDLETSKSNSSISLAIIKLAHSLDLKVIAEGVETKEQLELLKMFNCDEVQGYHISKPLEADMVAGFLSNY